LISEPDRVSAGNTNELYMALNTLKKSIARITLKALPLEDIQRLKDYDASINKYITDVGGFYDDIVAAQALLPADQKQKFNKTEDDLYLIRDTLGFISQSINAQISMYDSGVAQPVKFGGFLKYNLDEPLHKSAMYQTQKYL
jgi:predicted glycosyltransferase